jgi:Peptidase C39 family
LADRAAGELVCMYARLGRLTELETLLKSVETRAFCGPATEKFAAAREGLWNMHTRPEISFRCGPLALFSIKRAIQPDDPLISLINSAMSTPKGLSLCQVAELSRKVGLDFQMAFRNKDASFVIPAVVHFKEDHFAAVIRREGDRYLLQDPTFRNDAWVTQEVLETEASGYFLIPPGKTLSLSIECDMYECFWAE